MAAKLAQGVAGDAGVGRWQEVLQGFENHHVRTEAAPDAAEFEADGPGANHAQTRWRGIERERPGGVNDAVAVKRRRGNLHRHGTGREHDTAGFKRARLAFVRRELHLGAAQEPSVAGKVRDPIALKQRADTAGELRHHRILARHHARHVHLDAGGDDADISQRIPRFDELVGGVEQRLGGNAAPVEAGAAEGRLAIRTDSLVDAGDAHAELSPSNGGSVASGTGAYDNEVVSFRAQKGVQLPGVRGRFYIRPKPPPATIRPRGSLCTSPCSRVVVGATLVVARLRVLFGARLANTGDHKGRPYGGTIRQRVRLVQRYPRPAVAKQLPTRPQRRARRADSHLEESACRR